MFPHKWRSLLPSLPKWGHRHDKTHHIRDEHSHRGCCSHLDNVELDVSEAADIETPGHSVEPEPTVAAACGAQQVDFHG